MESRRQDPSDIAGQDAALLSAVEIGLGSMLHAFRVPLTGQFLSLNQIFMLSRSTLAIREQRASQTIGFQISIVAALLKSLAPAGKKLTPMLAIATQGLLFSSGTRLAGSNALGLIIGATLSSLWAFSQPFLLYLLIFGSTLLEVIGYFVDKLGEAFAINQENWIAILAIAVGLKIVLAWTCVGLAYWLPETVVARYQAKLSELRWKRNPRAIKGNAQGALSDLLNPLFVLSLALTIVFLIFVESSWSRTIWVSLRAVAVAYAVFYLLRWVPQRMKAEWLERWPLKFFARPLRIAASTLQNSRTE